MTTDAFTRLRDADPCPPGLAYDDETTSRNIRAIVGSDLVEGGASDVEWLEIGPVPRRGRARRWAIAAVAAVFVAAAVVTGLVVVSDRTGPATGSWVRYDEPSTAVQFDHPASWKEYHASLQSTVVFQEVWLSSVPFSDPCHHSLAADGTGSEGCGVPAPDLSDGGVFVDWSSGNLPSPNDLVPNPNRQIGGYLARVDRSDTAAGCPGRGAVAEVDAVIAYPSSSQNTRMTACVGPGDVDTDLAAIDRMLASVTFAGS